MVSYVYNLQMIIGICMHDWTSENHLAKPRLYTPSWAENNKIIVFALICMERSVTYKIFLMKIAMYIKCISFILMI